MIEGQPTLWEVKDFLGYEPGDVRDDAALSQAMAAAGEVQALKLNFPTRDGVPFYPDSLKTAFILRVNRVINRRNSPTGLVGFGEFGSAIIPRFDSDVEQHEAPFLKILVG